MRRTTEPRARPHGDVAPRGDDASTTRGEPIVNLVRRLPFVAMFVTIGLVIAVAQWSRSHERQKDFDDFSHEQLVLAQAVSIDFENRLDARNALPAVTDESTASLVDEAILELLRGARRLERAGRRMVLVVRPGQGGFLTTDHRIIASSRLRRALDEGAVTVAIPPDEAVAFGLPRRTAVAGLASVTKDRDGRPWGVVVLASAAKIRDREKLALWRFGLTILGVGGLVMTFGVLMQRRQRRELELERRVEVSALEREHEAALARADKMAALAAIVTGIAHEVGTPLGVIVGRVEQAMARSDHDERTTTALRIVIEQVGRIQAIIRGCLALARGDAPQLVKTAPGVVASQAVDLVRHRFHQANVELDWHVEPSLPEIACEPSLFVQALVNVLLNACQATPPSGTVRLDVRAQDEQVLFVVDDDGQGISDDVRKRIGEPFFSTKRDKGGSGLGLAITREIVNHHQGTFALANRETSQGTRATIAMTV